MIKHLKEEELLLKYFEHPESEGDVVAFWFTNTEIRIMLDNVSSKGTIIRQKNLGLALAKLGYKKTRKKKNGVTELKYHMRCNIKKDTTFGTTEVDDFDPLEDF